MLKHNRRRLMRSLLHITKDQDTNMLLDQTRRQKPVTC